MLGKKKVINFSDPLQGRRYISLFREDPLSGLRFLPDLNLGRGVLGFTFNTNSFGLRGPNSVKGPGVIMGTSYATGMAVDIGRNWYELCLDPSEWLNLGFPVGAEQMESLFKHYYRGPAKIALVLYHPNFWVHVSYYKRWSETKESVFSIFGWETRLLPCFKMKIRKAIYTPRQIRKGHVRIFSYQGVRYYIDCRYSDFDFDVNARLVSESLAIWERMLSSFEKVLVIRMPIKQELVPESMKNEILRSTLKGYDRGWETMKNYLKAANHKIAFFEPEIFELSDYQPWDSHWNETGNEKFAFFMKSLL